jgi:hypothetical protein
MTTFKMIDVNHRDRRKLYAEYHRTEDIDWIESVCNAFEKSIKITEKALH